MPLRVKTSDDVPDIWECTSCGWFTPIDAMPGVLGNIAGMQKMASTTDVPIYSGEVAVEGK